MPGGREPHLARHGPATSPHSALPSPHNRNDQELGNRVPQGTLLREFSFGHARQLESVLGEHLIALAGRSEPLAGIEAQAFHRHRLAAAPGVRACQAGRLLWPHEDRGSLLRNCRPCHGTEKISSPSIHAQESAPRSREHLETLNAPCYPKPSVANKLGMAASLHPSTLLPSLVSGFRPSRPPLARWGSSATRRVTPGRCGIRLNIK
jgi:hypothetical protein